MRFLPLGLVAALLSAPAPAATLRVPADHPTIWQAVDAAASGDSILIAPGTWDDTDTRVVSFGATVTSCGFLKGGLTLIGEGGADVTIVHGGYVGEGAVMTFLLSYQPVGEVVLEGLTVTGGDPYGIQALWSDVLTIQSCRFVGNQGGAAVRTFGGDLKVFDSEISFNTNVSGGRAGISAGHFDEVEVRRCVFEGNIGRAMGAGGGGKKAFLTDSQFLGNRAPGCAGAGISPDLYFAVERNLFLGNVATDGTGGALCAGANLGAIQFNTFAFDSAVGLSSGGGVSLAGGFTGTLANNTFYGCHADGLGAAVLSSGGLTNLQIDLEVEGNIFSFSTGNYPALSATFTNFTGGCNVIFSNAAGDFFDDWVPFPDDVFLDPEFCDPPVLDFTVRSSSPCADGNTPGCSQIGAWGVGCGPVSIQEESWGSLKARYRGPEGER